MKYLCNIVISIVCGLMLTSTNASENTEALQAWAKNTGIKLSQNGVIIAAIEAQNLAHRSLTQQDIDRLDKQWRAEAASKPGKLINQVVSTELSSHLATIVDSDDNGLYTEIFVMDNKGLNVGVSAITSDYWQGDEAKFKQTFGKGHNAIHVSDIEFDDSSQSFQAQVSLSISNGNKLIGAITFGIDVDEL